MLIQLGLVIRNLHTLLLRISASLILTWCEEAQQIGRMKPLKLQAQRQVKNLSVTLAGLKFKVKTRSKTCILLLKTKEAILSLLLGEETSHHN